MSSACQSIAAATCRRVEAWCAQPARKLSLSPCVVAAFTARKASDPSKQALASGSSGDETVARAHRRAAAGAQVLGEHEAAHAKAECKERQAGGAAGRPSPHRLEHLRQVAPRVHCAEPARFQWQPADAAVVEAARREAVGAQPRHGVTDKRPARRVVQPGQHEDGAGGASPAGSDHVSREAVVERELLLAHVAGPAERRQPQNNRDRAQEAVELKADGGGRPQQLAKRGHGEERRGPACVIAEAAARQRSGARRARRRPRRRRRPRAWPTSSRGGVGVRSVGSSADISSTSARTLASASATHSVCIGPTAPPASPRRPRCSHSDRRSQNMSGTSKEGRTPSSCRPEQIPKADFIEDIDGYMAKEGSAEVGAREAAAAVQLAQIHRASSSRRKRR